MKHHLSRLTQKIAPWHVALIALVIILGIVGYAFYEYRSLKDVLSAEVLEKERLTTELSMAQEANTDLLEETRRQQETIDSFSGQISQISSTVGVLEKLSQTDPELLKKYSKVYFLNENYVPAKLTEVDEEYAFAGGGGNFLFHAEAWDYLEDLLKEAREDDIELLVASAFRSFGAQAALKSEYRVLYGAGANQFSADQGYSEHQLGTSLDFTTPATGGNFSLFSGTPAYQWLRANAHRYGFILSYPEGNAYYKFEPWHWRFVGVDLATDLYEDEKYFYDLDQREIDTYLIKLFD